MTKDEQIEQLRVRLAGCSTAALGWGDGRLRRDAFGWSVAYRDVIELREKYEELLKESKGA